MPKGQDCGGLCGEPAGAGAVPPEVAWLEAGIPAGSWSGKAHGFPRRLLESRLPKADDALPSMVNSCAGT